MFTMVFAIIYKTMPRAPIDWKDVWIGAAATSLLFTVGKFLIGVYIGSSGIASGFGAAASLVVVMVWVYYSAQIFCPGRSSLGLTRNSALIASLGQETLPTRSRQRADPNCGRVATFMSRGAQRCRDTRGLDVQSLAAISTRTASCSCCQLSAVTTADPVGVGVCYCLACQRMTGACSVSKLAFPQVR